MVKYILSLSLSFLTQLTFFTGRKRRNSEDEDMDEFSSLNKTTQRRNSKCIKLSDIKRHKSGIQKRSTRGALLGKHKYGYG